MMLVALHGLTATGRRGSPSPVPGYPVGCEGGKGDRHASYCVGAPP